MATVVNDNQPLLFDGFDDGVIIPHNANLSLSTFSVETWVKVNEIKDDFQNLVMKATSGSGQENYGIFINPNTTQNRFEFINSGGNYQVGDSNNYLTLNEWAHLAMTYDGTNLKLYVNGQLDSSFKPTGSPLKSNTPLLFSDQEGYLFSGELDEVRIWNFARNEQQIQSTLNQELVGNETGLVGYWNFNDLTNNIVKDLTVNKNNGTIQGGAVKGEGGAPVIGNGDDYIIGTNNNDQLKGLDGEDQISGRKGNDVLDGGKGADILIGGLGNDTYIIDNVADLIIEKSTNVNEIDTVKSSVNYTLGNNLENLTLTGKTNINGDGNSLKNVITGNTGNNILKGNAGNDNLNGGAGNDTLIGGLGADILTGGTGKDRFQFNSANEGVDTIKDFKNADDDILINRQGFGGNLTVGTLP